ncbi:hypothetical protein BD324DRAFT_578083 [Kockovaella imperatae]|uniref:Integral membrane protein n=1 Tax=Kockovaella imperatae TaxID=4999 RepID=A0A1Y1UKB8_9TREE|nr:hypothetical protein BD324DRAFT_578083 [Kockovaella imperatae]ORX38439.1 hypothetical protein BD324DRAFT_578083 [Kockovaella imperatae]
MHDHGEHQVAGDELDESEIHNAWHSFPPTYLAADFRLNNDTAIFGEEFDAEWDPDEANGHRGLMMLHVLAMIGAYFVALPIVLALRAANSPAHYLVNLGFLAIAGVGWLSGVAYSAATPDRYIGNKHGSLGTVLLLTSIALAALDSLGLISRTIAFVKSDDRSWSAFCSQVFGGKTARWLDGPNHRFEMVGLMDRQSEEVQQRQADPVFAIGGEDDEVDEPFHHQSRRTLRRESELTPIHRDSAGSDGTLHEPGSPSSLGEGKRPSRLGAFDFDQAARDPAVDSDEPTSSSRRLSWRRLGEIILTWLRRFQVVFAYVVTLLGMTVYVGMCRGSFVNACAAHFIKGSIFFGYGVLTFARYLGAYSDLGWAWNRKPGKASGTSAEMVECSVIFVYGITNTWLERLGSHAGDPYTVRQVQHISIAIMFWFAGLIGILLESKSVRRVLGSMLGRPRDMHEPPSYAFSFNPLPALVIAVTGLAMAAHHQRYVFQVQIHSLWGLLLAGGSLCRFLTYFFLWIRPPVESTLPSRPPTEILTSFGWAAGGIVFMLSVEEVSWAAMRAGYDDMMAFLNITVALTCFVFCWVVIILVIKGAAVMRREKGIERVSKVDLGHARV